jgi:hypothetical protein
MTGEEQNNSKITVQISKIIGVLLLIGSNDFLETYSKDDTLSLALNAYKKWNKNWNGEGKFPIEVSCSSYNIQINSDSISNICMLAAESTLINKNQKVTIFLQPIVLTLISNNIQQKQVQSCLATFVENNLLYRKEIIIVNGSLNFIS